MTRKKSTLTVLPRLQVLSQVYRLDDLRPTMRDWCVRVHMRSLRSLAASGISLYIFVPTLLSSPEWSWRGFAFVHGPELRAHVLEESGKLVVLIWVASAVSGDRPPFLLLSWRVAEHQDPSSLSVPNVVSSSSLHQEVCDRWSPSCDVCFWSRDKSENMFFLDYQLFCVCSKLHDISFVHYIN